MTKKQLIIMVFLITIVFPLLLIGAAQRPSDGNIIHKIEELSLVNGKVLNTKELLLNDFVIESKLFLNGEQFVKFYSNQGLDIKNSLLKNPNDIKFKISKVTLNNGEIHNCITELHHNNTILKAPIEVDTGFDSRVRNIEKGQFIVCTEMNKKRYFPEISSFLIALGQAIGSIPVYFPYILLL